MSNREICLNLNAEGTEWEITRSGFSGALGEPNGALGEPNGVLPCPDWKVGEDIEGMMATLRRLNPGASVQVSLTAMVRANRAKARA